MLLLLDNYYNFNQIFQLNISILFINYVPTNYYLQQQNQFYYILLNYKIPYVKSPFINIKSS